MKILVADQILSGNLGEGWADENEAARGLAEYYTEKTVTYLKGEHPDAEIVAEFSVQRNTSGYSRGVYIEVMNDNGTPDFSLADRIHEDISYRLNEWWESWCAGDGSEYFAHGGNKMYKLASFDKETAQQTANLISGRPSLWDSMGMEYETLEEARAMAKKMSLDEEAADGDVAVFHNGKIVAHYIRGERVE